MNSSISLDGSRETNLSPLDFTGNEAEFNEAHRRQISLGRLRNSQFVRCSYGCSSPLNSTENSSKEDKSRAHITDVKHRCNRVSLVPRVVDYSACFDRSRANNVVNCCIPTSDHVGNGFGRRHRDIPTTGHVDYRCRNGHVNIRRSAKVRQIWRTHYSCTSSELWGIWEMSVRLCPAWYRRRHQTCIPLHLPLLFSW